VTRRSSSRSMASDRRGSHRSAAGHAEAAVRSYLDRIAAREAEIHAWAWLEPDRALAAARAADAASPGLPLYGRAIGVKDVIDTADMPTAYGSPIYESHRPTWDAACVAALRAAGAILLGTKATTEFAAIHPAPSGKAAIPNTVQTKK